MPRPPSTFLFASTLAFALALVAWWTWFQVQDAGALARAGSALGRGDVAAATAALGATDGHDLAELAHRRRTMFLSEGAVFAAILVVAGVLFLASVRRESRLQADHDRFLAGATHELKTPLATIRLLLESLRGDRLPLDKRDRYLQSGLLEAERLEHGLGNVLTAAGLRTAPRAPRLQQGDLVRDIAAAVQAMTPRAEAVGVRLAVATEGDLGTWRDPEAVQMVLRNLLDNAVKYSPRDSTVHVRGRRDGRDAVLSVRDSGSGMDADTLAHAFEPFWRGDQAVGGSGLGLHLVRELVLAHGGRVDAHSDGTGRGSELTVRLPLRGGSA